MVEEAVKDATSIVIAAYYEEASIASVISDLHNNGYENVIVVDDGSTDDTRSVAEDAGAIVLRHVVNRGQGAALQTGIEYALEHDAEYIVTFDADGQHRASDVANLLAPVASGEYDVALGSRFLDEASDVPLLRKILLLGSVIVQNIFYGANLTDAHNGFRCFSRAAAAKIDITSDRMEHASQIAEQVVTSGVAYTEVPVDVRYTEYAEEKGHGGYVQAFKVFLKMLKRKLLK
jgi:glycosyltransferase involved in cell wall biosynthesis